MKLTNMVLFSDEIKQSFANLCRIKDFDMDTKRSLIKLEGKMMELFRDEAKIMPKHGTQEFVDFLKHEHDLDFNPIPLDNVIQYLSARDITVLKPFIGGLDE
jgi:hypothetical protein